MSHKYQIDLARPEEDLGVLIEMMRNAFLRSRYAALPFADTRLATTLDRTLREDKSTAVFVAKSIFTPTENARVAGALIVSIGQLRFAERLIARVQFFYVEPEHRRSRVAMQLLDACRNWSRMSDVEDISIYTNGNEAKDRRIALFLSRNGFRSSGENLCKRI